MQADTRRETTKATEATEAAFATLLEDLRSAKDVEALLLSTPSSASARRDVACADRDAVVRQVRRVVETLASARKKQRVAPPPALDDGTLSAQARFTDRFALAEYESCLHYVPRIVNVVRLPTDDRRPSARRPVGRTRRRSRAAQVTLVEAVPVAGSGLTLPLDLRAIASKCNGSYYAPQRFAAVQLAFQTPRSRVLVFRACSGRGTATTPRVRADDVRHLRFGCAWQTRAVSSEPARSGPCRPSPALATRPSTHACAGTESAMAARLAIARAQQVLAVQAGVHLWIRSFAVINSVGAVSLGARLDCEAFATSNRDTSHYDRASFVGLAWRPKGEPICCEVYSTGRANLPGAVTERDLQSAWRRMLPVLLRHTTTTSAASSSKGGAAVVASGSAAMSSWRAWPEADRQALASDVAVAADADDAADDAEDDALYDDAALGALGL